MKRSLPCLVTCMLLCSPAGAAEVSNVFESGTPATAADVNQNFADVVAALNALEARVQSLEQGGGPELTMESVAGTYAVATYESEVARSSNGRTAFVTAASVRVSVTLFADGTATTQVNGGSSNLSMNFCAGDQQNNPVSCPPGPVTINPNQSDVENENGTWTLSGQTVTLNLGEDAVVATLTPNGQAFVVSINGSEADPNTTAGFHQIAVGVKLAGPQ